MCTQNLAAKIKAAEIGIAAQALQLAVEDDTRFRGMPDWKRKLIEAKEAKKIATNAPALAVALKSKELAEQEERERSYK